MGCVVCEIGWDAVEARIGSVAHLCDKHVHNMPVPMPKQPDEPTTLHAALEKIDRLTEKLGYCLEVRIPFLHDVKDKRGQEIQALRAENEKLKAELQTANNYMTEAQVGGCEHCCDDDSR